MIVDLIFGVGLLLVLGWLVFPILQKVFGGIFGEYEEDETKVKEIDELQDEIEAAAEKKANADRDVELAKDKIDENVAKLTDMKKKL